MVLDAVYFEHRVEWGPAGVPLYVYGSGFKLGENVSFSVADPSAAGETIPFSPTIVADFGGSFEMLVTLDPARFQLGGIYSLVATGDLGSTASTPIILYEPKATDDGLAPAPPPSPTPEPSLPPATISFASITDYGLEAFINLDNLRPDQLDEITGFRFLAERQTPFDDTWQEVFDLPSEDAFLGIFPLEVGRYRLSAKYCTDEGCGEWGATTEPMVLPSGTRVFDVAPLISTLPPDSDEFKSAVITTLEEFAMSMVSHRPGDLDSWIFWMKRYLDRNPKFFGAAIVVLEPDGEVVFAPYVNRTDGGYETKDLSTVPGYDLEEQGWFTSALYENRGVWTDPLLDQTSGEDVWVVTHSISATGCFDLLECDAEGVFAVFATDVVVPAP